MAFVNEYIPTADKTKHNITPDNHFYLAGTSNWTVDRGRDMFLLRRTGPHPEGAPGVIDWAFYWRGHLLSVSLLTEACGVDTSGEHAWDHKRLNHIWGMTPELEKKRTEIIQDLKEALTAHRGLGILGSYKSYELTLDVE